MVPKTAVAAAMLLAVSTSGCKTLDAARPPAHPLPIWSTWEQIEKTRFAEYYSKDSVRGITSEFALAQKAALVASATSSACKSAPVNRVSPSPAPAAAAANATPGAAVPAIASCPAYERYQGVGLMLSEIHCSAFLTAMDRASRHQYFARNLTSELGTGTSAVLSIFKTAAPVTGVVTTAFGAFESGLQNYDTAYLPAEEVRNARGVFQRARQALLANFHANPPTSLAMAEFRINYYASSCSMEWMRRLIDASVEQSNNETDAEELIDLMGATQRTRSAADGG